jgi:uncharacterized glyoxalase superfamily protein PhnB
MLKRAIPVLHVSRSMVAATFYEQLGFRQRFAYRPHDGAADPCYMGLVRDDVELHLSSFAGDGVVGGVANFIVDDVDALYEELRPAAITIELAPTEQSWGTREMYVQDPDGNSLRFVEG